MRILSVLAVFIAVTVFCFSCDKQDDLYTIQNTAGTPTSSIIAFQNVSSASPDADGVSSCIIKVKIFPEADAAYRTVTFKVNGTAKFSNGDTVLAVSVNTDGFATATLTNTKAELVHVKTIVSTFSIDTAVTFKQALPDDMQLFADSYVLDSATPAPAVLKAKLFRNSNRGLATDGAKVFFNITPLDTTLNFIYPGFQYTQDQLAVDTALNPFKIGGRFLVEAKTVAASGDTLYRRITFVVK